MRHKKYKLIVYIWFEEEQFQPLSAILLKNVGLLLNVVFPNANKT